MKTNRFEETIRKKVEGIQPEFADEDWSRFQKYYKANTPGSFWKKYGSKIAYGAAASFVAGLSMACGLLYYQNTEFRKEIAELKQIINRYEGTERKNISDEVQPETPGNAAAEDSGNYNETRTAEVKAGSSGYTWINPVESEFGAHAANADNSRFRPLGEAIAPVEMVSGAEAEKWPESKVNHEVFPITGATGHPDQNREPELIGLTEILRESEPGDRIGAGISGPALSRISPRKVIFPEKKAIKSRPDAEPLQQKNILPTFITSRPYRIGFTGSRTTNMYTVGVVNEFLLFPNISVTWGINRTRYNPLEFFNEKIFAEHTGQNFRKTFGKGGPLIGDVMNITTYSALTQIPLFAGYRQPLPRGFVLTGGIGTHLNIRFRQTLEYDFWDGHQLRKITDLKYKKLNYPVVNNFSPVLGAEKIFDPIVIQAEAYYHFQDKDIPYVEAPGGFGGRVKLLYQFGR